MIEMEKLLQAKDFMDKLSNGINPVSDEVLTKDILLSDIDLSRCFFFVSDILRKVIENGGHVGKKENLPQKQEKNSESNQNQEKADTETISQSYTTKKLSPT